MLLAVYRKDVEALVVLAPALLAQRPPIQAFRQWSSRFVGYGRVKHGIADAVRTAMSVQDFQETYWPIVNAVRQLLDACESTSDIRRGLDAEDLTQLLGCLMHLAPTKEGEMRAERLLAIVFEGICR